MSFRGALSTEPFLRMLAGHGMATLGQLQLTLAVGVYALERTGSGVWVSVAAALGFAPYILFSAASGVVADRYSRSSVLRWSVLLRLPLAGLVTVGLTLGWATQLLVALAALAATVATPSYPALAAATPQLVSDDDLPAANSLATGTENAAWVAGPGLLGLVLLTGAPVAGGGLAATACLASAALCLGRTRLAAPVRLAGPAEQGTAILGGVRVVASDRRMRATLGLAVVNNALYGYLVVAIVLVGDEVLDAGAPGIGWLNSAFATGAVVSMALAARIRTGREYPWLITFTYLFVLTTVALALSRGLVSALVSVLLAGLFTVIAEITAVTHLQRLAADQMAARVFGLYDTLAVGALTVSAGVAGSLSERFGVQPALLVACALAGLAATWFVRGGMTAGGASGARLRPRDAAGWLPRAPVPLRAGPGRRLVWRGPAGLRMPGPRAWRVPRPAGGQRWGGRLRYSGPLRAMTSASTCSGSVRLAPKASRIWPIR